LLRAVELDLRQLIEEASRVADYDSVMALGQLAKELSTMLAKPVLVGRSFPKAGSAVPTERPDPETTSPTDSAKKTRPKPHSARRKGYPRFERDGQSLVKVGWSKTSKAEYEHRAHRGALLAVVASLQAKGKNGDRFTLDEILPISDGSGGEVPSYQTYLCVAWLRDLGLIEQHGRQGYSIPRGTDLLRSAEAALAKATVKTKVKRMEVGA